MVILICIIIVAFIIGLLSRDKGDGVLDTLSSGCGSIISIVVVIIIVLALIYFKK